jgi:hypothetical protein
METNLKGSLDNLMGILEGILRGSPRASLGPKPGAKFLDSSHLPRYSIYLQNGIDTPSRLLKAITCLALYQ